MKSENTESETENPLELPKNIYKTRKLKMNKSSDISDAPKKPNRKNGKNAPANDASTDSSKNQNNDETELITAEIQSLNAEMVYQCGKCAKIFLSENSEQEYHQHLAEFHPTTKSFTCENCNETFENVLKLIDHTMDQNCGKLKAELINRENANDSENEENRDQEANDIKNEDNQDEKENMKKKTKPTYPDKLSQFTKIYKCQYNCSKGYHDHYYMAKRCSKSFKMNKNGKYECSICGKSFTKSPRLSAHMIQHDSESNKPSACPICGKICIGEHQLRHHIYYHKDKTETFQCSQCGKTYNQLKVYKLHLRGHVSAVCFICGKFVKNSNSLRKHVKTHSERPVWKCHACEKCYQKKESLNHHVAVHHPEDVKFYTCGDCGDDFSSHRKFMMHWRKFHEDENSNTN